MGDIGALVQEASGSDDILDSKISREDLSRVLRDSHSFSEVTPKRKLTAIINSVIIYASQDTNNALREMYTSALKMYDLFEGIPSRKRYLKKFPKRIFTYLQEIGIYLTELGLINDKFVEEIGKDGLDNIIDAHVLRGIGNGKVPPLLVRAIIDRANGDIPTNAKALELYKAMLPYVIGKNGYPSHLLHLKDFYKIGKDIFVFLEHYLHLKGFIEERTYHQSLNKH